MVQYSGLVLLGEGGSGESLSSAAIELGAEKSTKQPKEFAIDGRGYLQQRFTWVRYHTAHADWRERLARTPGLVAYAACADRPASIKLAVFDTDSTFINQEVIDEIADFAGYKAKVAAITERAMQGELDFNSALAERVALLRGLPESTLASVLKERLSLTPGAAGFIDFLSARGAKSYLLSGGFNYFTEALATQLGMTGSFANTLEIIDGKLTGKTVGNIVNRQRKAELLRELALLHGVEQHETLAVGDGANDIEMALASGMGVAFCAKPALRTETPAAVFHRDLRLIQYLL